MGNGYKEIKELGKGGFGKVMLVEKNSKYYALKKIFIRNFNEEEIDICKNEIKILSSFDSEFITKYYESYEDKDNLNIIMEYGGANNLKSFIKKFKDKNEFIDESIIENKIIQICLGLKEIHKNKIIHRDLTPHNIFINEDNQIKIGDFGTSKKLETINLYAQSQVGKHHYLAPEIEKGEKYDYRIDIYSLGCIIYELFTLNEYYIDKIDNKECKINLEIYNNKWQELIELLMKKDFHDRPNIEEILSYEIYFQKEDIENINNNRKMIKDNEIILNVKIFKENVGEKIYFLDNSPNHNFLKEMDESNTKLHINDNQCKYNKYFIPKNEGTYTIKIKLCTLIKDISYMFYLCENLTFINLSSFNTGNINNMEKMFSGCKNLTKIRVNEIAFKKFISNFPELKNKIDIYKEKDNIKNYLLNYDGVDLNDLKIFNKYRYFKPFYFYYEYPFIKDNNEFDEINIFGYEFDNKKVSVINKDIFENKSFNQEEFKKKIEENIEEIFIPIINLDNLEKNFDGIIIQKIVDCIKIYEKNAKNINKIIFDLNHLSKEIYEEFIFSIKLNINIKKIPDCRASYLESIGFDDSCEKFNSGYLFSQMVNNYLFDKKLIIYLKKKINDSFYLLKDIPNLNNEESAKNILKNLNLISNKICRLKNYFNEKIFFGEFYKSNKFSKVSNRKL